MSTTSSNEVIVLFDGYSIKLANGGMEANCTCTLIKSSKLIIVDTMTAWDRERIIEALAKHNIKPEDIDYVVCTHTHADHIGNNNLFTNAEHVVGGVFQRGTDFYERDELWSSHGYKLCPDVTIIKTPGHTPEDVTVLVRTETVNLENGDDEVCVYAITGDLFEKEEDILDPSLWKSVGRPEMLKRQSITRHDVSNIADIIIPGHGSMFRITDSMRTALKNQMIEMNEE